MPSFSHEFLVELFRQAPALARELLRQAEIHLPVGSDEVGSVDLSQVTSSAYAADVLVLVRGPDGRPLAAIIVEVQLKVDPDKRKSWPVYVTGARCEHDCPAFLLVVTPDERAARWAREPIELGHPGFRLAPLVVGPGSVSGPVDLEAARRLPELAVLAVLARPEEEVARTAVAAVSGLAEEQADLYLDVILAALPEAVRSAMEAWMYKHEYQSDFARRYVAQGRAEGQAEGRAEGQAEGRLGEARSAVLRVLALRGFDVSQEIRRQVDAEREVERLERWHDRAVTATSVSEVFGDG